MALLLLLLLLLYILFCGLAITCILHDTHFCFAHPWGVVNPRRP